MAQDFLKLFKKVDVGLFNSKSQLLHQRTIAIDCIQLDKEAAISARQVKTTRALIFDDVPTCSAHAIHDF